MLFPKIIHIAVYLVMIMFLFFSGLDSASTYVVSLSCFSLFSSFFLFKAEFYNTNEIVLIWLSSAV